MAVSSLASILEPLRERLRTGLLFSLLLGQLLSVLLTSTGTFSQLLAEGGARIPSMQSLLMYSFLSLYYFWRRWHGKKISVVWWKYALLALADVEANYLMVKAYQYTSITSVMILDCFTVPMSMVFSKLLLKSNFKRRHYVSVSVCLGGLAFIIVSDWGKHVDDRGAVTGNPLIGDALVLLSATCFSFASVSQELIIKGGVEHREYLGMIGVFGATFSAAQGLILDFSALRDFNWTARNTGFMFGFAASQFSMYSLTPVFIEFSGAVLLNLSLLTADGWAMIVSIVVFNDGFSLLYFIGFCVIVTGLVIYHKDPQVEVYTLMTDQDDTDRPKSAVGSAASEKSAESGSGWNTLKSKFGFSRHFEVARAAGSRSAGQDVELNSLIPAAAKHGSGNNQSVGYSMYAHNHLLADSDSFVNDM